MQTSCRPFRKASLSALLASLITGFLLAGSASAQPGCGMNYALEDYCSRHADPYIFVGTVMSLERFERERISLSENAVIRVETAIKGNLNGEMAFPIKLDCLGQIAEGGRYIFSFVRAESPERGLSLRGWSASVDNLSAAELQKIIASIRALNDGAREPLLSGEVVHRLSRSLDSPPLAGVTVIAKGKDAEFATVTDEKGAYRFDKLPGGLYSLHLSLPEGLEMLDVNGKPLGKRRLDFQYERRDWPCGQRMPLYVGDTAAIRGTVIFDKEAWSRYPYFKLLRLPEGTDDRSKAVELPGEQWAEVAQDHPDARFRFDQLQPGRYILRAVAQPKSGHETAYYYPGVESISKAAVIEIHPGEKLDVEFELPTTQRPE